MWQFNLKMILSRSFVTSSFRDDCTWSFGTFNDFKFSKINDIINLPYYWTKLFYYQLLSVLKKFLFSPYYFFKIKLWFFFSTFSEDKRRVFNFFSFLPSLLFYFFVLLFLSENPVHSWNFNPREEWRANGVGLWRSGKCIKNAYESKRPSAKENHRF